MSLLDENGRRLRQDNGAVLSECQILQPGWRELSDAGQLPGNPVNYTDPSGYFAIAGTVTAGWDVYELGCLLVGAVVAVATGY